jgi:hypothetical protein
MSKLHVDLLLALRGAAKFGVGVDELLTDLRRGRHRELALPDLEQALRDLADKSFATTFNSALGSKRWRITALGMSALQEESL